PLGENLEQMVVRIQSAAALGANGDPVPVLLRTLDAQTPPPSSVEPASAGDDQIQDSIPEPATSPPSAEAFVPETADAPAQADEGEGAPLQPTAAEQPPQGPEPTLTPVAEAPGSDPHKPTTEKPPVENPPSTDAEAPPVP